MTSIFKSVMKFLLILLVLGVLFSFAMFQGGFLSWFLFYTGLPFILYYILLLLYPLRGWKLSASLSSEVVHAGDEVLLKLTIDRKLAFPLPFMVLDLEVPDSLHKKDTRSKERNLFSEGGIIRYERELKEIFFPWFRRRSELVFTLDNLPRGEHRMSLVNVKVGDLFGFMEREHSFPLQVNVVVYPVERRIKVMQYLTSFEGGVVPYYTHQLKNTNVAGGVREYAPGDKFSCIDWKQTARQQEIMTKEFDQEKSAEMIMIFNALVDESLHPIAFEAAVELSLAMFEDLAKKNGGVDLFSLGNELTSFSSADVYKNDNQLRHHFARVQAVENAALVAQLDQVRTSFDAYDTYVFITTLVNRPVMQSIDLMKQHANKLVVLYIQANPFIMEDEQKNMQILRSQGVSTYILTDKQLSFDPIEVKF